MDDSGETVVSSAAFEFNNEQNKLIGDLSLKMRFVGTFLAVIGVLVCVRTLLVFQPGMAAAFVQGIVFILVGVWSRQAGTSFQVLVDTTGDDIHHLMNALASLKKCYTLQFWLLMISVIALVVLWALVIIGVGSGIA